MISKTITLSTSAKSLSTLLGQAESIHCTLVILQAPSGNSGVSYYGDLSEQPMTLAAGSSAQVPLSNTSDLWLKGTASDLVNVFVATGEI
jgi:hypothetical protein